jgi:RNA polymerase sigma-70 factor, ECF subfamily
MITVDPAVIERAIAGDERAFADLVTPFRTPILKHLTKMLRDPDLAEDVWQDVQFRVWRSLDRFDPAKKFSTWMYAIATNTAINSIRDRKRHRCLTSIEELGDTLGGNDRIEQLEDNRNRPDELLEDRDLNEQLAAAVLNLSPVHRRVLILRELRGQSYDEIAAITDAPMGTVKSRLARARASVAARVA